MDIQDAKVGVRHDLQKATNKWVKKRRNRRPWFWWTLTFSVVISFLVWLFYRVSLQTTLILVVAMFLLTWFFIYHFTEHQVKKSKNFKPWQASWLLNRRVDFLAHAEGKLGNILYSDSRAKAFACDELLEELGLVRFLGGSYEPLKVEPTRNSPDPNAKPLDDEHLASIGGKLTPLGELVPSNGQELPPKNPL